MRWLFAPLAGCSAALAAALASVIVIASAAAARAAETPIPPPPSTWVTDNVGLLAPSTRASLEQRLAAYNRATGHQVIVWIGATSGDAPLEDWTIRAFTAWKVGRKKLDDGLALFIFTQDRKTRIEVGYGLEGQVTDAAASRIARNEIASRMKVGDGDGAVTAGVSALLATIGGENGAPPNGAYQSESSPGNDSLWIFGLLFVIVLVFLAACAAGAGGMYTIGSRGSKGGWYGGFFGGGFSGGGGWGGSSGGGFGGFSGGGGMGGGGGASAGW